MTYSLQSILIPEAVENRKYHGDFQVTAHSKMRIGGMANDMGEGNNKLNAMGKMQYMFELAYGLLRAT